MYIDASLSMLLTNGIHLVFIVILMRWYTRQDYYSPWTDQSTLNSSNHLDGGYSGGACSNHYMKMSDVEDI
ncbi:hypothetical protein POVCU1_005580 [Plasmodium ovale curtisi]|uniref:Uncharacterized protein n=1 Tax=Plasmodium ovale curtisi TaxID=864141 RepID=A0A1A8VPA2_PLAOA|nr:hypothetical protein POVCU1_005580 [Plasmodium ovale curtisi]